MLLNLPRDISSEQVDILVCGSEERSGLEMEAARGDTGLGAWEGIHSHEKSWDPLGEKRKGPRIPEAPQCLEEEEAAKEKNKERVGL